MIEHFFFCCIFESIFMSFVLIFPLSLIHNIHLNIDWYLVNEWMKIEQIETVFLLLIVCAIL